MAAVEYSWSGRPDVTRAVRLVRLGRLSKYIEESLVIDYDEHSTGSTWVPKQASSTDPCSCSGHREEEEADDDVDVDGEELALAGRVEVEDDLLLEDLDVEEEASSSSTNSASSRGESAGCGFAPGSFAPRMLMQARAQQCVVCLQDKEHTFVPPHFEDCSEHDVSGHRFCTDCWLEYLYHCSRRYRRAPAPLVCPLCRGGIHVPDVWGAAYELPRLWLRSPEAPEPAAAAAAADRGNGDEHDGEPRRQEPPAADAGEVAGMPTSPESASTAATSSDAAAGAAEAVAAAASLLEAEQEHLWAAGCVRRIGGAKTYTAPMTPPRSGGARGDGHDQVDACGRPDASAGRGRLDSQTYAAAA